MIRRLGDLLRPTLASAGLEATSELWKIGDAWHRAVGEAIASHATPAAFRRGELLVAAPEAVWRQELSFLGPDIKLKLNLALGENLVERIRVVAGPAFPPMPPPSGRGSAARPSCGAPADGRTDGEDDLPGAPAWLDDAIPEALRSAFSRLDRARAARLAEQARGRLR